MYFRRFPVAFGFVAGQDVRQGRTVIFETHPEDAGQRTHTATAQNDTHRQWFSPDGRGDV